MSNMEEVQVASLISGEEEREAHIFGSQVKEHYIKISIKITLIIFDCHTCSVLDLYRKFLLNAPEHFQ